MSSDGFDISLNDYWVYANLCRLINAPLMLTPTTLSVGLEFTEEDKYY